MANSSGDFGMNRKNPVVHTTGFTILGSVPSDNSKTQSSTTTKPILQKAVRIDANSKPILPAVSSDTDSTTRKKLSDDDVKVKRKVAVVEVDDDEDEVETAEEEKERESRNSKGKKKKKKRKKIDYEALDDGKRIAGDYWWILPAFLIVLGLVFTVVGGIGFFNSQKIGVVKLGILVAFVFTIIQFLITIPAGIVGLFIGGKLFGIEYGTILETLLGIAAVSAMVMGVDWMLHWMGLWFTPRHALEFIIGYAIFQALFQLDHWEAIVSLICLKIIIVLSMLLLFFIALGVALKTNAGAALNDAGNDDDPPAINQKDDTPKGKNKFNKRNRDPDDDDEDD